MLDSLALACWLVCPGVTFDPVADPIVPRTCRCLAGRGDAFVSLQLLNNIPRCRVREQTTLISDQRQQRADSNQDSIAPLAVGGSGPFTGFAVPTSRCLAVRLAGPAQRRCLTIASDHFKLGKKKLDGRRTIPYMQDHYPRRLPGTLVRSPA